jgi:hypothetical protein
MKKLFFGGLLLATGLSAAACILISSRVEVRKVDPRNDVTVNTSVKAHLKDGSTVTYPNGVSISGGMLRGEGFFNDLTLTQFRQVREIPLDSVVGMESFRTRTNRTKSIVESSLATAGATIGGALLAIAIFGSCPTVYSNDGTVEEAELFSSSIVPLFEARDLDRLHAQPDANGTLELEVRNEAMETHYINHLQVIEVRHASNEIVLPGTEGGVVAVRDVRAPAVMTDRTGRDVLGSISAVDEKYYATDPKTVDNATAADMNDWLDFTVPSAGSDKVALVFRLRNSLLSTTLLYDVMLGAAGARALDWLNQDLAKISTAVDLGRWYQKRAGLHISVWRDGAYREVVRIPDSGPISWHDVAASIPVLPGETSLRIRLSFLADHWRIDRIGIAGAVRPSTQRVIQIADVTGTSGGAETEARLNMSAPDTRYLQTSPGQRFFIRFDAGPAPASQSRTFLLSAQGYYTEWIRGSWIKTASADAPFAPTDESLLAALDKWSATRDAFEKRFREKRVPVH